MSKWTFSLFWIILRCPLCHDVHFVPVLENGLGLAGMEALRVRCSSPEGFMLGLRFDVAPAFRSINWKGVLPSFVFCVDSLGLESESELELELESELELELELEVG